MLFFFSSVVFGSILGLQTIQLPGPGAPESAIGGLTRMAWVSGCTSHSLPLPQCLCPRGKDFKSWLNTIFFLNVIKFTCMVGIYILYSVLFCNKCYWGLAMGRLWTEYCDGLLNHGSFEAIEVELLIDIFVRLLRENLARETEIHPALCLSVFSFRLLGCPSSEPWFLCSFSELISFWSKSSQWFLF